MSTHKYSYLFSLCSLSKFLHIYFKINMYEIFVFKSPQNHNHALIRYVHTRKLIATSSPEVNYEKKHSKLLNTLLQDTLAYE